MNNANISSIHSIHVYRCTTLDCNNQIQENKPTCFLFGQPSPSPTPRILLPLTGFAFHCQHNCWTRLAAINKQNKLQPHLLQGNNVKLTR